MLSVCPRYLRHREDAEEVMLMGFVKVFRALDQYRYEGSFEGWIRKIMVNEALGQLRRLETGASLLKVRGVAIADNPAGPGAE